MYRFNPEKHQHGMNGYSYGCRCEICKEEWNSYQRIWRAANLNQARKTDAANARSRRTRITELLAKYKDKPCTDCGSRFPSECMDFDHLEDKDFNIGQNAAKVSATRLEAEIAKCEVVCSNCHRIRTRDRKAKLSPRRGYQSDSPQTV